MKATIYGLFSPYMVGAIDAQKSLRGGIFDGTNENGRYFYRPFFWGKSAKRAFFGTKHLCASRRMRFGIRENQVALAAATLILTAAHAQEDQNDDQNNNPVVFKAVAQTHCVHLPQI